MCTKTILLRICELVSEVKRYGGKGMHIQCMNEPTNATGGTRLNFSLDLAIYFITSFCNIITNIPIQVFSLYHHIIDIIIYFSLVLKLSPLLLKKTYYFDFLFITKTNPPSNNVTMSSASCFQMHGDAASNANIAIICSVHVHADGQ